jgi:hypothetical protein
MQHDRGIFIMVQIPANYLQSSSSRIQHIQKVILEDLRPVRPLPPSWALVLAFGLVFAGVSYWGVSLVGAYGWMALNQSQRLAIFGMLAASAVLLVVSLTQQMIPGQMSWFREEWLPIAVSVSLSLTTVGVFPPHPYARYYSTASGSCFRTGFPYTILAGVVFWLMLRQGAMLSPRIVGATAGMLAGLVGTTVLEAYCPNHNFWHVVVGHFGIAFLGMIAGLLIAIGGQAVHRRLS